MSLMIELFTRGSDRSLPYCPAEPESRLSSMGTPIKVDASGKPVFLCCTGCREGALADPKATLAEVEKLKKINVTLAKLVLRRQYSNRDCRDNGN